MKKLKNTIIFAVLIIVIIATSLVLINIFQNISSGTTISNAQLNNAGYFDRNSEESKLFLASANASYGVYSANASYFGGAFDNQDCFVITAKIRNDYTVEQLQLFDVFLDNHNGRVYFAVTATLYEGTSQVSANDVTGAIIGSMSLTLGVPQWRLESGETDTVEIYMTTNNRSIDNYSINLKILDLSGHPIP